MADGRRRRTAIQRRRHAVAGETESALRVLITNEQPQRVKLLAQVVAGLGYEVIARDVDVEAVAAVTAQEHPDVALVGVGRSSQCALGLIEQIAHGSCPVIALLSAERPDYVREAARRGVFAYVVDTGPEELQSAIDITLERCGKRHEAADLLLGQAIDPGTCDYEGADQFGTFLCVTSTCRIPVCSPNSPRFPGVSFSAGGGTRTPDTRIMIVANVDFRAPTRRTVPVGGSIRRQTTA